MFAAALSQSALSHLTLNLSSETGEKYQGSIQKTEIEDDLQKQLLSAATSCKSWTIKIERLRRTSRALPQKWVCFASHQYSLLWSIFGCPKPQAYTYITRIRNEGQSKLTSWWVAGDSIARLPLLLKFKGWNVMHSMQLSRPLPWFTINHQVNCLLFWSQLPSF